MKPYLRFMGQLAQMVSLWEIPEVHGAAGPDGEPLEIPEVHGAAGPDGEPLGDT